jgi:SAM-dependent methyltransferase
MTGHDSKSSAWIWTQYWRTGRQGCLTDEAPPSAQAYIESLWRGFFRELPRGARVIDLACGSGDVARIALSVGEEARLAFAIEGVDLAQLGGEERSSQGTTLRLRGGVDLALLPFPDNSFDGAVSQFGIEYAELEGACRELTRVLKPAGRGLFLIHHNDSAISAAARSRLQAFASVIADGSVFERARQVYAAIAGRAAESLVRARIAALREQVRSAVAVQTAQYAWEVNLREILGFLSDLARNPGIYDPLDALRRIDAARDTTMAWKARQQSQLGAAQNEADIEAFAAAMRASDLEPREIGSVNDPASGAVLAWRLAFVATGSR